MLKDKIGWNAGVLWRVMYEHKEISVSELVLLSKLNEADFNMAIGWLFRENKIAVYENEGKQITFLVFQM